VLSNFMAIPLMGLAGVFLEGDLLEDYSGVFSFIALSYILTPYQAYAALKGLLGREGTWTRTLKTGYITESIIGIKFRGLFKWLREIGASMGRSSVASTSGLPPWISTKGFLSAACLILMVLPFLDRFASLVVSITCSMVATLGGMIVG
jgi:hypothetical protein